ncbi:MAG TPA: MFS transporter, partial [Candidatus Dormibacteraeota bacterium]|nr:MFS transporter [Candidatus Dormibacteraeota bacterium]
LAEIVPARRRGQIIVLVAGIGTGLGFLLTSGLANWTMPHFGWRIMWFYNLPTGGLLILLNRYIPESPRFLIEDGRVEEAQEITRRFGATLVPVDTEALESHHGVGELFRGRFFGLTTALVLYGLGWGAVNFGFLTWLPSEVASHGLSVGQVSGILTNASLFSLPGAVAVSWLYGRSTKLAMVVVAVLTASALATFVVAGAGIASHTAAFTALLVCLLVSLWGVIAVLAPYSAEVYPTRLRARGAGLAAGASKLGGVIALGMGVAGVAPPDLAGAAALTGAAVVVGAVAIGTFGIETRRRRLEDITASELSAATA